MKISNVLSNTILNIYSVDMVTSDKGSRRRVKSNSPIIANIRGRVEMRELDTTNPITIGGRLLTRYYLVHIWNQSNVDLNQIKDGYIIQDDSTGKEYEILEITLGTLLKHRLYKLECKCMVKSTSLDLNKKGDQY